ncbi:DMT family transporter [uncultured Flavobacterium sp.]|uniref:DMT family transporter n=1 Tax=uncultured Flavobacterium sp. TaxID=165435 RepID=UPI0030CA21A5|tara:strand:- start:89 stop:1030 length:942 start_codon:yes stop_codon:yes gene_type:complete
MQKDNSYIKNYLHLHLIVFIWGFTAILGKVISLEALNLVCYRMFFGAIFIYIFIYIKKLSIKISFKTFTQFALLGIVIAAHWFTFYEAIKVSNISITLACLSTGAFFASIIEPVLFKKKLNWLNLFLGLFVIVGLYFIAFATTIEKHGFFSSFNHIFTDASVPFEGVVLAIISAFLSALFSVINGKFAKIHDATIISFYEIGVGFVSITIYMLFADKLDASFFQLSLNDFFWLMILSSICTAYAFLASVKVMKIISPFTVMLTTNLEPIYGIILALLFYNETEKMSPIFYIGAFIILISVLLNGFIKIRLLRK